LYSSIDRVAVRRDARSSVSTGVLFWLAALVVYAWCDTLREENALYIYALIVTLVLTGTALPFMAAYQVNTLYADPAPKQYYPVAYFFLVFTISTPVLAFYYNHTHPLNSLTIFVVIFSVMATRGFYRALVKYCRRHHLGIFTDLKSLFRPDRIPTYR
jgi:hypothetical protein